MALAQPPSDQDIPVLLYPDRVALHLFSPSVPLCAVSCIRSWMISLTTTHRDVKIHVPTPRPGSCRCPDDGRKHVAFLPSTTQRERKPAVEMRKFIDKVKHHLEDTSHQGHDDGSRTAAPVGPSTGSAADAGPFPNVQDWYRYRKQRGVNLGSWFVLERWIADSPFRNAAAPAQSDLDVAKGNNAKEILERHWDTWITQADWAWLADKGINTVRIPIGYYHICGADPGVLEGTDFADLDHVFAGAWARVTNALATAHRYGIGVLFECPGTPPVSSSEP
ncbi:glycoside hydrolase family 5 protein [Trametes sanguinea]|nr:glycoside hydrolase family 5 protein [Trametes sanguinea]